MAEVTDLEKVGQFVDGPYDTDVTLYRPDIQALMGRDPDVKDDPLRLAGPFPLIPGFKLKAATNDWTFSPFLYLWEDLPYEDPGAWRRAERTRQTELNLDGPFITTFGPKSMNGLGTYYGTFITEMEAFSPEVDIKVDDNLKGIPNFLTNPGKKGTGYGYNGLTINPYPEYMADPAFDIYEARKAMREEFEAALVGDKWRPTAHPGEFFNPNPFFDERDPDGGIETYDWDRLVPDKTLDDVNPVWKPPNHTKCINGNKDVIPPFERFPEYDPSDPWEPVPPNIFRTPNKDPDLAPWKAQFGNRTRQQRSVLQYNIKLWVNPTTFHMY